MKLETQQSYVTNPQFIGGDPVTFASSSQFASASAANPQWGYVAGGLYVGTTGTLVAKTYDSSVLTFVSASGFIPGIFTGVSDQSTCGYVLALK